MAEPWKKYAAPAPTGPWEKYGGASPPPALPDLPQDQSPPILPRALANLPQSLINFGKNAFPMGMDTYAPGTGKPGGPEFHVRGPFEEIGGILSGIGSAITDPGEAFARDPVGTIAYPAMALHGGITREPGAFVKGAAKEIHPLNAVGSFDLTHPFSVIPKAWDWAKTAAQSGMEGVRDYRTTQDIRQQMRNSAPPTGSPTVGRFDVNQYGSPQRITPVETGGGHVPDYAPSSVPGDARNPVWSAQPATSPVQATSPIQPINASEGSMPTVQSVKHPAAHTDLIRQAHALAQELDLPGSPAGTNGHPILSKAARDVYGVNSYSKLSYEQKLALHEYMLTNHTAPTGPQDLLPK